MNEERIEHTPPHDHDAAAPTNQETYAPVLRQAGSADERAIPSADVNCMLYDETLLDVCRTRWQFGDWSRLTTNQSETLLHHPERARIALLTAAAHFQLGESQQGHRQLQLALDWGASRRQVMQMLISGVHSSLAEASLVLGNDDRARAHFREAMRTGGVPGDIELLAQAREARRTK